MLDGHQLPRARRAPEAGLAGAVAASGQVVLVGAALFNAASVLVLTISVIGIAASGPGNGRAGRFVKGRAAVAN